jgi:Tfp pilus assembly protein PilO
LSLFFIAAITFTFNFDLNTDSFIFIKDDFSQLLISFLQKIPFYIPFIWFAIYSAKRRGEYERLSREYTHKYTNAVAYESYKEQIKSLNTSNELLEKLMENSIEINAINPSNIVSTESGYPLESSDKK